MSLCSRIAQQRSRLSSVCVGAEAEEGIAASGYEAAAANLRVVLDQDETIWTESSHKYKAEEIPENGRTLSI